MVEIVLNRVPDDVVRRDETIGSFLLAEPGPIVSENRLVRVRLSANAEAAKDRSPHHRADYDAGTLSLLRLVRSALNEAIAELEQRSERPA